MTMVSRTTNCTRSLLTRCAHGSRRPSTSRPHEPSRFLHWYRRHLPQRAAPPPRAPQSRRRARRARRQVPRRPRHPAHGRGRSGRRPRDARRRCAARRVLALSGRDPAEIGLCIVGTETAVDHSKPVAAFLHGLLGLPVGVPRLRDQARLLRGHRGPPQRGRLDRRPARRAGARRSSCAPTSPATPSARPGWREVWHRAVLRLNALDSRTVLASTMGVVSSRLTPI